MRCFAGVVVERHDLDAQVGLGQHAVGILGPLGKLQARA
jgi:hypothetical protein